MRSSSFLQWRFVLTAFAGLAACTNHDVDPNASGATPTKGSADFTKYVAVGNSLTAGYADGGLYLDGQLNSYPNILAGQFSQVGGGAFVQPLFDPAQANGTGYLRLRGLPSTATLNLPVLDTAKTQLAVRGLSPTGGLLYSKFTGANQNLGVPAIKMADLLKPGYGSVKGNPYFERLVPDAAPLTTYYDYINTNLNGATFFTSWLGNNDALGYAISGGADTLTNTAFFTANYTVLINKLTENSRKGVIIGIPSITGAPYFTTVNAQLAAQKISGLVIQSKSAPGGVRLSTANDYILLSAVPLLARTLATGQGVGTTPTNPIPDRYVLDQTEATALNAQIGAYNSILKAQADAKGLAYMDPNTVLGLIGATGGLTQNGVTYTAQFIQGGAFSLDGIHLTPAGYALIANEIIKSINAKYGATLSLVNPSNYRRVLLQ